MSTRWEIEKEIVQRYKLGKVGINDTATSNKTTLQDDSQFGAHRGAEDIAVGSDVLIRFNPSESDTGTNTYHTARVSKLPSHAAGAFEFDPAIASAPAEDFDPAANVVEFLVLRREFWFEDMQKEIDLILGENFMWQKLIVPLTEVTDGDMRALAETAWTLANATDAKAAATFPNGARAIVVTDSGSAGGYTSTGSLAVEEKKTYYLEVTGYGTDADDAGELQAKDVTDSNAEIALDLKTIDRIEPEILRNPSVLTPSGCKQVDLRLVCTNASDIVSWANLIWRKNEQTLFTLEDKPYRIHDIGEVRATSEATWGRRVFDRMAKVSREVVQLTEGLWQIQLKESVAGRAVFFEEWVAPGTLSADSSTTIAPKEDIAAVVAERMLRGVDGLEDAYARAAVDAARVIRSAQSQRSYINTDQRVQYQAIV